jgi:hypothetical protein
MALSMVFLYTGHMSVEFEGDYRPQRPGYSQSGMNMAAGQPGLTGWLIRKGIVKDESQAKVAMLGLACLNFILIILIFVYFVF